jgi:hypothetical protein
MVQRMISVHAVGSQMRHAYIYCNVDPRNLLSSGHKLVQQMKLSAINARITRQVYSLAEAMWVSVCNSIPAEDIQAPDPLREVLEYQTRIGLHNFVIVWFVKAWAPAMKQYGSKDPDGQVAQLLMILWDGLCEPVWEMCNNILHKKPNPTVLRETEHL